MLSKMRLNSHLPRLYGQKYIAAQCWIYIGLYGMIPHPQSFILVFIFLKKPRAQCRLRCNWIHFLLDFAHYFWKANVKILYHHHNHDHRHHHDHDDDHKKQADNSRQTTRSLPRTEGRCRTESTLLR